jgi:hypothetical protein
LEIRGSERWELVTRELANSGLADKIGKLEAGSGSWKPEAGSWKLEAGS